MQKFIYNLRRQPEEVKRHILHVLVAVAGIVLLAVWVYSLGGDLSDTISEESIKKNIEPLSVLKNNLALPKW